MHVIDVAYQTGVVKARGFELVTRRFELVTCKIDLVTCEFELVNLNS